MKENVLNKTKIKVLFTAMITILLIAVIAPCAFANDTANYTISSIENGIRIESVETSETVLVIPDQFEGRDVVEIALNAFANTAVEEITIPATVTKMSGDNRSALCGMEFLTKVTFAEGMRTIPDYALAGCESVTEVVLPESLTTVSAKAFYNCTALKTINLPDSITTIGDEAFSGCSALEEITLPAELTALGHMAFANCTKISEIALPEYLTTIGTAAFMNTKIAEITIPANVTSMHGWYSGRDSWYSYSALDSMENLTKVTFAEGMRTIPENALYLCSYVTEVVLPESLTTVSAKAFYNCTALKTINLPDSITTIGDEAFSGCSALEEITLPAELTALGHMAFANCTKISEIALPEYLTTIGTSAFMNTEIAEITIPANVTSMYGWYSGRDSWYSYSALDSMENLTKVTFADGMRVIPENALYNCTYLNEVVVYDCNTSLDAIKEAGNTNGFTVTVLACEECFHTETVYKDAVDATCTTEGYTGDIYCADCDEFISEGEAVAVTEHNFGEWTVVVEATVEAEGQEERACSACDAKETRAIEKLEDNNIIVTEDSTITVDEESMQTSIESDKTVEDIIAQIENQNVIIITPTGEEITADAAVGTGCVIIINNIIQYNIIVHYDVDGNGKVTPADARLALRASAGLDILDGVYETAANYDGKESVSTSDARMILRKAAGLE